MQVLALWLAGPLSEESYQVSRMLISSDIDEQQWQAWRTRKFILEFCCCLRIYLASLWQQNVQDFVPFIDPWNRQRILHRRIVCHRDGRQLAGSTAPSPEEVHIWDVCCPDGARNSDDYTCNCSQSQLTILLGQSNQEEYDGRDT
jgi:hypothetical protein